MQGKAEKGALSEDGEKTSRVAQRAQVGLRWQERKIWLLHLTVQKAFRRSDGMRPMR